MNALQIMAANAAQLNAIVEAIVKAKASGTEASEAKGSVAQAVREYAVTTAEAGTDTAEARKALQIVLAADDRTTGSVKATGHHYVGFRTLIADGVDVMNGGPDGKPVSTAEAQARIASDDVKARKALKSAVSQAVKAAGDKREGEANGVAGELRLVALVEALQAAGFAPANALDDYRAIRPDQIGQDEEDATDGDEAIREAVNG